MKKTVEITKLEFHRDKESPLAIAEGVLRVSQIICVKFHLILGPDMVEQLDALLDTQCEFVRGHIGDAMQKEFTDVRWASDEVAESL